MSGSDQEFSMIEDLEHRQDDVLDRLDELNDKIESTLNKLLQLRSENEEVHENEVTEHKKAA